MSLIAFPGWAGRSRFCLGDPSLKTGEALRDLNGGHVAAGVLHRRQESFEPRCLQLAEVNDQTIQLRHVFGRVCAPRIVRILRIPRRSAWIKAFGVRILCESLRILCESVAVRVRRPPLPIGRFALIGAAIRGIRREFKFHASPSRWMRQASRRSVPSYSIPPGKLDTWPCAVRIFSSSRARLALRTWAGPVL